MKIPLRLLFLLFLIYPLSSLQWDELVIDVEWDKEVYYQGENGKAIITIKSNCPDDLKITWVGIHFEWMEEGKYFSASEIKNKPLLLSPYTSSTLSIPFSIPHNAKVGWNKWYVSIICTQYRGYGPTSEEWESSIYTIYIRDIEEKEYYELVDKVLSRLTEAENYKKLEAKRLIAKAKNEYEFAISAAKKGKWREAVSCLKNAYNFLTEAEIIEGKQIQTQSLEREGPIESPKGISNFIFYLIGFILLGILIFLIIFRQKTKIKKAQT